MKSVGGVTGVVGVVLGAGSDEEGVEERIPRSQRFTRQKLSSDVKRTNQPMRTISTVLWKAAVKRLTDCHQEKRQPFCGSITQDADGLGVGWDGYAAWPHGLIELAVVSIDARGRASAPWVRVGRRHDGGGRG